MIKAVVFDCFGVLCSDAWLPYKQRHFGHNPQLSRKATSLNKAVDAGKLDYKDFIRSVAQMARLPEAEALAQIENNIPDTTLFDLIIRLKPHYKIGMLSNAGENWLDDIFTPGQVALFDGVTLSCDIGYIKPEPEAYRAIVSKLGVLPEECVFIDDQPKYVAGAQNFGMQAIVFTDRVQLESELGELLGS